MAKHHTHWSGIKKRIRPATNIGTFLRGNKKSVSIPATIAGGHQYPRSNQRKSGNNKSVISGAIKRFMPAFAIGLASCLAITETKTIYAVKKTIAHKSIGPRGVS